ncbi:ABC transporter permease [Pseudoxanthomonas sp. LjRoot168]|uniref:ABC transporter permease n=1 Tax=unclassified Pseudoxanthomonas TaxID=2645906 RepID=UPI003ECC952E
MNMKSTSQHMNWGALLPAYVILGGAALLALGGAQEIGQNNGHPFGVALALLASAALFGVLAVLTWMNWRAARFRASRWGLYDQTGQKGGFFKGFLLGLLGVFVVHVVLFFAAFTPAAPDAVQAIASIALLPFAVLYTVVPLATGYLTRFVRATRI